MRNCVLVVERDPSVSRFMQLKLEEEGFVITIHGKGSFVAFADQELMLEEKKKEVEADLEMAIRKGKSCGMTDQELLELFQIVLED